MPRSVLERKRSPHCIAFWALAFLFLALVVSRSEAKLFGERKARVIVDATSTESYREWAGRPENDRSFFYHITKGKFYEGEHKDSSLERTSFEQIAFDLVKRLEQRGMYLAPELDAADMMIVVHWGTTNAPIDWDELLPPDDSADSFDNSAEGTSEEELDEDSGPITAVGEGPIDNDYFMRRDQISNSRLLGFDRAMDKPGIMPSEFHEYQSMLLEERYFMVVQAFDFPYLKETKELKLLWTTRFSTRAAGTNFEDAYLALTRVAAPHFGANLDDLAKERTHYGPGEGSFGELEVISVGDEEAAEKE